MNVTRFLAVMTLGAIVACGSSDEDTSAADPGDGTDDSSVDPKDPLHGNVTPDAGDGGGSSGETDAGEDGSAVAPGTCGTASPPTGFIASTTVKVGTANRTYALTIPAGYKNTTKYPLVVGFHGDGGNGAGYRASFPIEAQAAGGAIFVWPDGTNNNNGHSFDQAHDPPNNADVSFFDAIVAAVGKTYCINTARVYVHGMSGGAYFTNQLGRWRATAIRGLTAMSGGGPFGIAGSDYGTNGQLTVNGTVPALLIHGQADTTVPITEGQKSLAYWRMADQNTTGQAATDPSPCQKQSGGVKTVTWCVIPGLSHAIWPGAAQASWAFFSKN